MERIEVLPLVQADLAARIAKGATEYGEPLTTHNGRDALQDAYEEALDLCVYLKQAILEKIDTKDGEPCSLCNGAKQHREPFTGLMAACPACQPCSECGGSKVVPEYHVIHLPGEPPRLGDIKRQVPCPACQPTEEERDA